MFEVHTAPMPNQIFHVLFLCIPTLLYTGAPKTDKKETRNQAAKALHEASKTLMASWAESLEEVKHNLPETDRKAYVETLKLEKSPKFQMISHLVVQAFKEKESILVFTGALFVLI